MSLNLILSQNCDPVTYVQVMYLLEKVHKRKRKALAIHINQAVAFLIEELKDGECLKSQEAI